MASLLATAFLFCNNPAPVLEETGKGLIGGVNRWRSLVAFIADPECQPPFTVISVGQALKNPSHL
jgi:hypothetical protein